MNKKILYIDMDGVLCDIEQKFINALKETPEIAYPQSQYGFFLELDPIKDCIDAVKSLGEHYDIWFLSAPSYRNPMCYAEKNYWIRKHFGIEWTEKLILSCNKSLLMGDYLIDDNYKGRGQEFFKGQLIHFGTNELFMNWKDVFDYLINIIEHE